MTYICAYVAALLVFGACDAVWLSTAGPAFYKPALGDILLSEARIAPAVVFYVFYPVGVVLFGVTSALRTESFAAALMFGGLFGAFAYATYDLTNFATLRNWTLQVTVVDTAYGAVASALASAAGLWAALAAERWFGTT